MLGMARTALFLELDRDEALTILSAFAEADLGEDAAPYVTRIVDRIAALLDRTERADA